MKNYDEIMNTNIGVLKNLGILIDGEHVEEINISFKADCFPKITITKLSDHNLENIVEEYEIVKRVEK